MAGCLRQDDLARGIGGEWRYGQPEILAKIEMILETSVGRG
jgi:hypothetical protein